MASPLSSHRPRPITRPSGGALANDESDAAPNRRTSESDRARYPGPAAATCLTPAHHQAGPPARLCLSHSAPILLRANPQTPQSRSQPGARGTWAAAPPEVPRSVPVACAPMWLLPDSTSSLCSAVSAPWPWHPHPQSHSSPAQPRSSLVSLSLARSLSSRPGAVYGRSGWIDEGFFLARTPSPPYLAPKVPRRSASRPRHHFAR